MKSEKNIFDKKQEDKLIQNPDATNYTSKCKLKNLQNKRRIRYKMKPNNQLQLNELNTLELREHRNNARILMQVSAGVFAVWLLMIFWTSFYLLSPLGFIFLFISIIMYIDMRYYDIILRLKEVQHEEFKRFPA